MIKTLTFACVHFTVAFTVAYLLTGSMVVGGLVALVEPLCNTVAYHLHEKAWLRFGGRTTPAAMPPAAFGHGHLSGAC
jgi:uncharacterized membrane protein